MPASARRAKGKARASVEEITTPAKPLGKQLAHTDKKIRDRAFRGLRAFVSRGAGNEAGGYTPLDEGEMKKLWKGLFYCFWMSDKPLVQQSLAADLAELVILIEPSFLQITHEEKEQERFDAALAFLEGFWKCIVREWDGIDRLRIDKFYLLIRRFLNASFRLAARRGWRSEDVKRVNQTLAGGGCPLSYDDRQVPISLAMHLSDIYLEELDKVLGLPEVNSQPPCPILLVLSPMISLLLHTPTQSLHNRISSSLLTPLLTASSLASSSIDPEDRPDETSKKATPVFAHLLMGCSLNGEEDAVTPDELKKGFLKYIFREAGSAGVVESSRRKVYKLYREEMPADEDD